MSFWRRKKADIVEQNQASMEAYGNGLSAALVNAGLREVKDDDLPDVSDIFDYVLY